MNYAALTPIAANTNEENKKPVSTLVDMKTLDTLEEASTTKMALKFKVTCAIKQGQAVFFAQLKGGKRFATTPVMPKAIDGSVLAPANGKQGYLALELSENANLQETQGKFEFTVRPVFIGLYDTVEDAEAATKPETPAPGKATK